MPYALRPKPYAISYLPPMLLPFALRPVPYALRLFLLMDVTIGLNWGRTKVERRQLRHELKIMAVFRS
jgi:hypothetical protein